MTQQGEASQSQQACSTVREEVEDDEVKGKHSKRLDNDEAPQHYQNRKGRCKRQTPFDDSDPCDR